MSIIALSILWTGMDVPSQSGEQINWSLNERSHSYFCVIGAQRNINFNNRGTGFVRNLNFKFCHGRNVGEFQKTGEKCTLAKMYNGRKKNWKNKQTEGSNLFSSAYYFQISCFCHSGNVSSLPVMSCNGFRKSYNFLLIKICSL